MRKISLFLCILAFSVFTYAQGQLRIYHLDVGQGNSTFIVTPSGKSILIDADGNVKGNSVVLPFLSGLGITQLDYVIASHYHADHIGGVRGDLSGDGLVNRVTDTSKENTLPATGCFGISRSRPAPM